MCQPKSRGGRRCTPHTAQAVTAATEAIHAAIERTDGSLAQRGAALDAALVRGRLAHSAMADREAEVIAELGAEPETDTTPRQEMLRRHRELLADAREPYEEAVREAEDQYAELVEAAPHGKKYDLRDFSTGITARESLAQKLLTEHPEWSRPGATPAGEIRAAREAERIAHEKAMLVAPLVNPVNLEALSAALAEAGMAPAETAPHDRGAWLHRQTIAAEAEVAKRGRRSTQVGSTFVVRPPHGAGTVTLIRRPSGWALCDYSEGYDSRAAIPGLHAAPRFERAVAEPAPVAPVSPTPGFFEQLFGA
ncbi:hypothetical protein [Leucobacter salsicius]|uniref:hypothetical protein n=1 Tax=Leucobacter salsicius TaxID=664638 RepID=UPI00034D450B|nr:hypothetical protein [Leucobacter salsicius]